MSEAVISREEWNRLRYSVEIKELTEEEGGGWMAWIPRLGKGLFMLDGDDLGQLLVDLEERRKGMYDLIVESGQPIPMPEEEEELPSGKWLQRTSRVLHQKLKEASAREGVSFNTYVESALERDLLRRVYGEALPEACLRAAEEAVERLSVQVVRRARAVIYDVGKIEGPKTVAQASHWYCDSLGKIEPDQGEAA